VVSYAPRPILKDSSILRIMEVVEVIVRAMRQWFEVSRQWRREEEIEREGERVMCYKGNDVCM
jgi:hypothetical protein